MTSEPPKHWKSPRTLKVAAIIGLGWLACSTAKVNIPFESLETGDIDAIRVLIEAGADANAVYKERSESVA